MKFGEGTYDKLALRFIILLFLNVSILFSDIPVTQEMQLPVQSTTIGHFNARGFFLATYQAFCGMRFIR
jgi:hypothetical protein